MTGIQPVGVQPQAKKTGGDGKAVLSFLIPGLGQALDGRVGAGIGYMTAFTAATITSYCCNSSMICDVYEDATKELKTGVTEVLSESEKIKRGLKSAGCVIGGLAAVGIWLANIVDAYKGDRSKKE